MSLKVLVSENMDGSSDYKMLNGEQTSVIS